MWARVLFFSQISLSAFGQVVGLDLCADQWLLALAKDQDIQAVTSLAQSEGVSYFAERAKAHAIHKGTLEEIITSDINTVISQMPIDPVLEAALKKRGVQVVVIGALQSVTDLVHATEKVGAALKVNTKALVQELQALKKPAIKEKVVFLGVGENIPGSKTLLTEAVEYAGMGNSMASRIEGWGYTTLEELLQADPDRFILLQCEKNSLWNHPAMQKRHAKKPHMSVPKSLTLCHTPQSFLALIDLFKKRSRT